MVERRTSPHGLMALLVLGAALIPSVASPQQQPGEAVALEEADAEPKRRALEPEEQERALRPETRRLIQTGQGTVQLEHVLEELIDDLIDDLRGLETSRVSPVALRRVELSPNLSEAYGLELASQAATAVQNSTELVIKPCPPCQGFRTQVEGDDWVLGQGLGDAEEARQVARRLGVEAYLDLDLAYYPNGQRVSLRAALMRAEDGAVMFSQTYEADPETAAVLRRGGRVQTRSERLAALEETYDARPYFGYTAILGGGQIPYEIGGQSQPLTGGIAGIRLYEQFGDQERWLVALSVEGFLAVADAVTGSFVQGVVQYQVNEPDLNGPVIRTGPAIGGFLIGNEGNSLVTEWQVDAILQFRLGLGGSVFYFFPVSFAGGTIGGLGFKGRFTLNW